MITIKVDATKARAYLNTAGRQIPYAAANALNRTAEEANAAIRDRMQRVFTIREPRMLRWVAPVKVPTALRARKDRLWVVMQTEGQGTILDPYQAGEPRTPDRLGRLPAVPSTGPMGLRSYKAQVIPRSLFPHNLGLQPRRSPTGTAYYALGRNAIKRGLTPFHGKSKQGKRGTFEITGPHGNQLIYQRMGPGKRNIRLLWTLKPVVRRPPILGFYETATRVFDERWELNFAGMYAQALRTAR